MDSTHDEPFRPELDAYLAGVERALPSEAVAGVYLTGSVALDDYRHGHSDLDILTLTTRPLTEAELDALEALHKELEDGTQPHTDAVYVPREHVGGLPPEDAAGHGLVVDGEFQRRGYGQALVLWATLAQSGVTVRGPAADTLGAAPDRAELIAWNRGNLEEYWRTRAAALREHVMGLEGAAEFPAWLAIWFGTGPGRLHRTITTGEIISKSRSADHTAELLPVYSELLARVKASRAGDESIAYTKRDGSALCDLVDEVCDSLKE